MMVLPNSLKKKMCSQVQIRPVREAEELPETTPLMFRDVSARVQNPCKGPREDGPNQ